MIRVLLYSCYVNMVWSRPWFLVGGVAVVELAERWVDKHLGHRYCKCWCSDEQSEVRADMPKGRYRIVVHMATQLVSVEVVVGEVLGYHN